MGKSRRDGRTARRHHTGILRRGVWCASRRPHTHTHTHHPWASASSYLSSQSLADSRCSLHATSRSSHSRRSFPCRFFFCRLSAQLRPPRCISWPLESIELSSSKDESSDAHCYQLPPSHVIAQVHSLFEHLCLH